MVMLIRVPSLRQSLLVQVRIYTATPINHTTSSLTLCQHPILTVFPSIVDQSLFIFSELGVRPTGDFRIRLDLVDRSGSSFINLGCVYTDRFVVVGDKSSHPGLSPSSDLMQAIVRRGLKLRLTKASKE
jgi:hypothetical protein